MGRPYVSYEDARQAFDAFARLEPRLKTLWDLCRRVTPPAWRIAAQGPIDDAYDADPYEVDALAADSPDDGWCAEDYFHDTVKSKLLVLVGAHRVRGPHELQSPEAYDTVYRLLIDWALNRLCACCVNHSDDDSRHRGDAGSPAYW